MGFPSDLEIARSVVPKPIGEIASALGFRDNEVEPYGRTKAKLSIEGIERLEGLGRRGKYVVVTAIVRMPAARAESKPHIESSIATQSIGCAPRRPAASRYGAGCGL